MARGSTGIAGASGEKDERGDMGCTDIMQMEHTMDGICGSGSRRRSGLFLGQVLPRLRVLFLLAGVLSSIGQAVAGDSITLRPAATVAPGAVTLGDVAELEGEAKALATVGLGVVGETAKRVTVEDVRAALAREASVNWGRVSLSGGTCTVRAAVAAAPVSGATAAEVSDGPRPGTVRFAVASRIAELLAADESDLRLTFDPQQSALLEASTVGRVTAIQPVGMSDRMALSVRLYDGDRLALSGSVRVDVKIRRSVATATANLTRGQSLNSAGVAIQERWIGPTLTPADTTKLSGRQAKTTIPAGNIILASHVESPVAIKKGDKVSVDCISGGLVVRVTARAIESGREGQEIRFVVADSKETFKARVQGPGRAITTTDAARDEERLEEPAAGETVAAAAER